jgi:hypothetical protein
MKIKKIYSERLKSFDVKDSLSQEVEVTKKVELRESYFDHVLIFEIICVRSPMD